MTAPLFYEDSLGEKLAERAAAAWESAGSADDELIDDPAALEEKMKRLTVKLDEQFTESAKLEKTIRKNLAGLELAGSKRL